jgi:hypothetical protein
MKYSSALLLVTPCAAFAPSRTSASISNIIHPRRALSTLVPLHLSAATAELTPGINVINELNADLEPKLDLLRAQNYFRLYSVDMLGSCEYMPQELFECYSETCEIYPIDEEEVRHPLYMLLCLGT